VEEKHRNVVGGFQNTLQSCFELGSYILVLTLPHPNQFIILAVVSYLMVVGAALLFSLFVYMNENEVRRRRSGGKGEER